jgi:hypothetical protein
MVDDWATLWLALYFACFGENHLSVDGAVYRRSGLIELSSDKYSRLEFSNPFEITTDYYLRPPHITPRITTQASIFTVSKDPTQPLEIPPKFQETGPNDKLIVGASAKESILKQLIDLGISHATLFPDLDGLCKQIATETTTLKKLLDLLRKK